MPVRWELDSPFVRVQCVGTYEPEDMRAAWREMVKAPDWPERPLLVVDMSKSASVAERSVASLRSTADFFKSELELRHCRTALIASGDLAFGLMRMVSAWLHLTGTPVAAFRSEQEAMPWLLVEGGVKGSRDESAE